MSNIDLTEEEFWKLKTLADYMFWDEYQNKCSSEEFEKSFEMFFYQDGISLENVFNEIAGEDKKFITFQRLIKAYLTYKHTPENLSEETQKYFKKLAEEIIRDKDDTIGSEKIKAKIYSSTNCKNKDLISKITIYQEDGTKVIKGLKLEYDDSFKAYLYDKKNKDLNIKTKFGLEELKDAQDPELLEKMTKETEFIFRDSVTHIVGTFTDKIEYLGFMLRSGRDVSCGLPKGKPFLFGLPGYQFHYLKMKVSADGIVYFEPHFKETPRINTFINLNLEDITEDYLNNDIISEEVAADKKRVQEEDDGAPRKLRAGKKKEENELDAVFNEKGDPLDSKGQINQYYLEVDDGYILGIENNSNFDYTMGLRTDGMTVETPKKYAGKQNIPFFKLEKGSKMSFKTTFIPDYEDEISFIFESVE